MIAQCRDSRCSSPTCCYKNESSTSSLAAVPIEEQDPSECPTSMGNKLRRDVTLTKYSGAGFGAEFVVVGRRLLVCFVSQAQDGDILAYSAAYRAGLRVGDEILSFNETDVLGMEPWAVESALRSAHVVTMEIREAPLTHTVHLEEEYNPFDSADKGARHSFSARKSASKQRHNPVYASEGEADAPAGIIYSEGKVSAIVPNSLAEQHHVPCGETIVEINGHCTLGAPDHEVRYHLFEAAAAGGEFIVKTMRPAAADGILEGLITSISNHRVKCTAVQAVDSDFSTSVLYSAPPKDHSHEIIEIDTSAEPSRAGTPEPGQRSNHHKDHHHHHSLFNFFHLHHRNHHSTGRQNESVSTLESTNSGSSASTTESTANENVRAAVLAIPCSRPLVLNQVNGRESRATGSIHWGQSLVA
eukprot:comp19169_c0_seq1/m.21864 comp19169_c0_seq1/g.21864  ORF comp19169_c0_seq1/g.21864 comp19169_c0_seq1/m.21864 type:complete len:415 (-) comp19169_c0_seq1:497-1741(-)